MKKLICLTLIFIMTSAKASVLDLAKSHLENKKNEKAIELLYQVSKDNEDYPEANEILVKYYFKNKNYSKLFANALHYRTWLKDHNSAETYRPKTFAIEALALAMNCHENLAKSILDDSQVFSNEAGVSKNYIAQTRQQLKIGQTFPEFIANNRIQGDSETKEDKDIRRIWKIASDKVSKLPNAKNLSMKLESRCKK